MAALLGAVGAALLLLAVAPAPPAALRTLREAGSAPDPTAPVVAVVCLLAWLLASWLLVAVAVTAGGHLPGLAGRGAAALARRLAPATVRRTVELALGLTVAVGAMATTPAAAQDLDWPTGQTHLAAAEPAPAPPDPAPAHVLVEPGDCLWTLAEQHLAARGAATSDAAVAQAWPSWWAANREVIGDDPDLLRPGTRLAPPPASS